MSIKVITGKVRASFVHVFEPQSINGSEPKGIVIINPITMERKVIPPRLRCE